MLVMIRDEASVNINKQCTTKPLFVTQAIKDGYGKFLMLSN